MMQKRKLDRAKAYLVAAVFLACYLTQRVDCVQQQKVETRDGQKTAKMTEAMGVREGKILFGKVFVKGPDGANQASSNASAADEIAYQADSPDAHYMNAWARYKAQLWCAHNQMKLRVIGPGVEHFALNQGNGVSLPVSQIPSHCGYNIHQNPLVLVMVIPYSGCNIFGWGGGHFLPMHWHGHPLSLWCPAFASPTPTPPQDPQSSTPVMPPFWPPWFFGPHHPFFPHHYPWYHPTAEPTTTTSEPATTTGHPGYPWLPFPFPWPGYPYPWYGPTAPTTDPTSPPPTMQPHWPPHYTRHSHPHYHGFLPYLGNPVDSQDPAVTTTNPPATTVNYPYPPYYFKPWSQVKGH